MPQVVPRRALRRRIGAALFAVAAAACQGLGPADRAVLDRWLNCYECGQAEFDSLRAVMARNRDELRTELIHNVLYGPSASVRTTLGHQIGTSFDLLPQAAAADSAARQAYIAVYLRKYVESFRLRSAQALAWVGGGDSTLSLAADNLPPTQDTVSAHVAGRLRAYRDSVAPLP